MILSYLPDMQGYSTEKKIQLLTDAYYRLKKDLEDALQNLDEDNIPKLSNIIGDINGAYTQISQLAHEISLKASLTVTDGLETRLSEAELKITPEAIVSTVRQSTEYLGDIEILQTQINQTAGAIVLKADKSVTDDLASRLSSAELKITSEAIVSTVRNSAEYLGDIEALSGRISTAETQITQTANSIALKADKTITDGLDARLSAAELKITDSAIVSTVRGSTAYINDLANKANIDTLVNLQSNLQSQINQQAEQISMKVSQTDFNGNTIASLINQTATTIKLSAQKIDLAGAVTFSDFSENTQAIINNKQDYSGVVSIINGTVTADYINSKNITARYIKAECEVLAEQIRGYQLNLSGGGQILNPAYTNMLTLASGGTITINAPDGVFVNGSPVITAANISQYI